MSLPLFHVPVCHCCSVPVSSTPHLCSHFLVLTSQRPKRIRLAQPEPLQRTEKDRRAAAFVFGWEQDKWNTLTPFYGYIQLR
jgi:hypothetical protein